MKRTIIYKSKTFVFTNLLEDDLSKIKNWRNEQMKILRQTSPLTDEDQAAWFKKVLISDGQKIYSVLDSKKKLVAYCGLTYFDKENSRSEISFVAETKLPWNEYELLFNEVLEFLTNEGFNTFKLHKLFTETFAFRNKHISILENNGFTKTGVLKDHIKYENTFHDSIIHSKVKNNSISSLLKKKILVTGAAGVIGQELVKILSQLGAKIRCVDIAEKPESLNGVDYWRLDLSNRDSQYLVQFQPEIVFHLAADFERSTEDLEFWDSNFKNNILSSHYLLQKIFQLKSVKRVVFASSYLIYDKLLYNNTKTDNVLSENSRIDPRNLTGLAKLQTERDIEFHYENSKKSFSYAIARIFRSYGRNSRDIVSRWIRSALAGEKLVVFSENNSFDYIHARDVAEGLISLAQHENALGIYNLSTGVSHKISELIQIIKSEIPKTSIESSLNEIYPECSRADINKIESQIGWKAKLSLLEGVRDIIEYEKKQR